MDVVTELEQLRGLTQPLLDEHGGRFEIEFIHGAVHRTEMRPELISAVMSALIANAIEWRERTRELTITVRARPQGDSVELFISDNGRGVTPGLGETIFEPMVSGKEDGTGMGLTVARSIIEAHGGSIALINDRRRTGAAFRVLLLRKKARAT